MAAKLDTHRLMSLIPIMPYHRVANIGAGTSGLTLPLAKYLFDGKVYSIDGDEERLKPSREAVEKARLRNVETVVYKVGDKLPIDDNTLDGALMVLTLGQTKDPIALLEETKRALKKSGWLVIVGPSRTPSVDGAQSGQFVSEEDAIALAQKTGYRVRSQKAFSDSHYMLLLRK